MHISCLVKICWDLFKLMSWKENMDVLPADGRWGCEKFDKTAHQQSQTRSTMYTISMQIPSLVNIDWYLLNLSSGNENTVMSRADNSKIEEICSLAIPDQISTISMHIPSLVKIHLYLLNLSSGNKITVVSQADNSVKNWRNLPTNNPKPDLYNINAHTKFGENPLIFTQFIIRQ